MQDIAYGVASNSFLAADAQTGKTGKRRSLELSDRTIPGLVAVADMVAIVAGFLAACAVYLDIQRADPLPYLAVAVMAAGLMVAAFRHLDLYDFETLAAWPRRTKHMLGAAIVVLLVVVGFAFALKVSAQYSRVWFAAGSVSAIMLVWLFRGVAAWGIRHWTQAGHIRRRIAIVGAGAQAGQFIARLQEQSAPWTRIVGVFDDRDTRIDSHVGDARVLGKVDDLIARVRRNEIDEVVVALPWSADRRLFQILNRLRELPVDVHLGPDLIGYHIPAHTRRLLAGMSVLQIESAPFAGWPGIVKRIEDKVLAGIALLVFGPLMVLIAIAIKLDSPGPVLFRQNRYGFNNGLIEVFKFRTMHHHMRDENAETLAGKADPRVTRLGRLLRRTSLDELPQLFNVLNGSMSMVGPRPHATRAKAGDTLYQDATAQYAARHRVKPGITGWAQVNGWRGETDTELKLVRRVEHDLYYIEHWSLFLDAKILLMTIWSGFRDSNAY